MKAETTTDRTIGRASIESQELFKFLESCEVGKLVTYLELNAAAKVDVQSKPNVLQTARRMMEREHHAAFGTVRGVGIRRLADEEIPDESTSTIKRARNIARKGKRLLGCANYEALTPDAKMKYTINGTLLGFMEQAGARKTLSIAEQSVRCSNGKIETGSIMDLFQKSLPAK